MSRAPRTAMVTAARGAAPDWRVLAVAAVLTLATVGAYWNSFNVPFLLDDSVSIVGNPSIRHLGRIGDVFSPSPPAQTVARPLLNLSFALNYAAGGVSVRGYHTVNLLIHLCAGLTLLGIVCRTLLLPALRPRYGEAALPLAACAASLWTLHPLQTEAVTYISQRAESLMGLFYLLTLYGFIRAVDSFADVGRGRRTPPYSEGNPAGFGDPALHRTAVGGSTRWFILSVAACLCGMATKQIMVTAPVLVLLYDRTFVSGSFRSALANRRWYYASLATTWLWLGFLIHHSPLAAVGAGFQARVSWQTYALTELRVVTDYLKLAFWPHPLVFDYGSEILVTDPLTIAPYALLIVALLTGVVIVWRRSPRAGFLGAWFFLILAPTSTVVPIVEQPMAESRMYLPLAALVVFVALLGYALGRRRAFVVLGTMAVGLGALTVQRNHDYRSELSIWENSVARHPHASRGHYNLALALAKVPGRMSDVIAHNEEALRLKPAYAEAHNNLGIALTQTPGRMPEAIAHCEEALRLKPDSAEAHNNLGIALVNLPGRLPDAIAHFEAALRLNPDSANAHDNLGLALANIPGRIPDAIAHFEAALRLRPDYAETHDSLARLLAGLPGRMPDAIAHYEEATRLMPDLVEVRCALAAAYAETGRLDAALAQLEIASRLNPASVEIRDNLERLKTRRRQ